MAGEARLRGRAATRRVREIERLLLIRVIESPYESLERRFEAVCNLARLRGPVVENDLSNIAAGHGVPPRTLPVALSHYAERCLRWLRMKKGNPSSRKPPPKPDPYRLV